MSKGVDRLVLVQNETQDVSQTGDNRKVPKTRRKSISKTTRFEVFKRDSFACQYCGRKSPDVVLSIDHMQPLSKGGPDDVMNYVTACLDCNTGKGARTLDDHAVIDKQRRQLDELQARKEQLEMLVRWRQELMNLEEQSIQSAVNYWSAKANGWGLTDSGVATMRQWVRRFSLEEVMKAIEAATTAYLVIRGGSATQTSINRAWKMIPGICRVNRMSIEKPYMRDLFYIRGILRRRFDLESGNRDSFALSMLEDAHLAGAEIEFLKDWAKKAGSWWYWTKEMSRWVRELESESEGEP